MSSLQEKATKMAIIISNGDLIEVIKKETRKYRRSTRIR